MTTRPLKLGITLAGNTPVPELVEEAQKAEAAGFDVILTPDHLGLAAPTVSLVAIAAAAPSVQVSTLVLNASFYSPALLARDLAAVDSATGGRLIIALGTGYVEAEFDDAGIPFPSPGRRVAIVGETMREVRRLLADPGYTPPPVQSPPPVMVAGQGDKMLTLAAQEADIVGFASMGDEAQLAERVAFAKDKACDRFGDLELQFGFFQVSLDDPSDLSTIRNLGVDAPDEEIGALATVLNGSVDAAAERILRLRDDLGITYFTFLKTDGTSWKTFGELVDALR
jgi:probable F420-dependent oxidoreductase